MIPAILLWARSQANGPASPERELCPGVQELRPKWAAGQTLTAAGPGAHPGSGSQHPAPGAGRDSAPSARTGQPAAWSTGAMPPPPSPRPAPSEPQCRWCPPRRAFCCAKQASAQWAFRRRGAWVLMKRKHPLCCGDRGGPMSFWLPPNAPWSLDPGFRREDDEINQRQLRALPFPPRKRGPRSRGGAAATGRTSAQWVFSWHGA